MTGTLAEILVELQQQLPNIAKVKTARVKTKTGADYEYKYENLGEISRQLFPLLGKLGLSWICRPTLNAQREFVLAYELRHIGGESIEGEYPLSKGAAQAMGSEITYARRYCLCAVTGVAPDDDDDDGAAAAKARQPRQRAAPAATRPPQPSATPVTEAAGGITGHQMRHMQALFGDMKVTDRGNKLAYAIDVIRRPLDSATQLTEAEADQVIDKLKRWKAQETPPDDEPPAGE